MKTEDIKRMAQAWKQVQEASAEKPEEISEIARSMTPMRNMFGKSKAEKEAEAKKKEAEAKATKKEAMDPVDKSELKGKHKDRKDKDIDNDGDVDSTDKYLHKRRKAVSKAIASKKKPSAENDSNVEVQTSEAVLDEAPRKKRAPQIKHSVDPFKAERERNRAHDAAMGRTPTGRKKPERTMNSTQRQLATIRAKMANEEVEQIDEAVLADSVKKLKLSDFKVGMFVQGKGGKVGKITANQPRGDQIVVKWNKGGTDELPIKGLGLYTKPRLQGLVMGEEVEQIDEVSKKTLGSYVTKAAKDMENRGIRQGNPQASIASVDYHSRKADKRAKGIARAVGKMAKEEVEMDESRKLKIEKDDTNSWAILDSKTGEKYKTTFADRKDANLQKSRLLKMQSAGKKLVAFEAVDLDEVSTSTLMKYRTKANRSKDRASDSAIGKMLRSKDGPQAADISKDVKTMDKRAKGLKMADKAAARNLRKDLLRKEEVNLDEVSSTTMQRYKSKAGKIIDTSTDEKEVKKRSKGYTMASKKLTRRIAEEIAPKGTHKPNNGSDSQQGLSPNAKKMMAMKTDAPEGADITKVAPKTFAAMRASGKKAAMRNNDNPQGDKTPPKNDGK